MTSIDTTIKGVMNMTWSMVFVCIITFTSLRITYIIKNNKRFILYQEIFNLFFLIYILCLFQIVTYQDINIYDGNNNLIPFKEILRYNMGSRLFFKNVIGNIILFIPYGLMIPIYTNIKKLFPSFSLIFLLSVTIEATQTLIGRVFDIDDIILNLLGGIIGFIIYSIINKIGEKLPKVFRSNWFLNIISFIFVCILVFYIWRLFYE